jgi:hypothetical protein
MWFTSKSYNSINETENVNSTVESSTRSYNYSNKLREICDLCCCIIIIIAFLIIAIFAMFIVFSLVNILNIIFGEAITYIITGLFGEKLYNKYFPICSTTSYNVMDGCYTTTNVYCDR